jgi:hypothetical protein
VECQVVHRTDRAGDVADAGNIRRSRDARDRIGRLGEPEERHAVAVARVEKEVLARAARHIERLDQRHAKHVAVEVDGALHVRTDQRDVIDPAERELVVGVAGLDHLDISWESGLRPYLNLTSDSVVDQ